MLCDFCPWFYLWLYYKWFYIWWIFLASLEWSQLDHCVFLNVLLNSVCMHSVEDFCIYVYQWCLSIAFCLIVSWFGFDSTIILIDFESVHSLSILLNSLRRTDVSFLNCLIKLNNKSDIALSLLVDFALHQFHYLLLICLN